MKKWLISSIITVIIWVAGGYGLYFIKNEVPSQLNQESIILASSDETVEDSDGGGPKELKEIIYDAQKLVIQIELANGSLGSGFLYNEKGDVITNAHVVAGATEVKVTTTDSREFTGKVIGISEDTDVAVVRVDGLKGMKPLKVRREKLADIGEEVLALGSPLGLQNTVTTGIISGIDRDFDLPPYHYEDAYQISAPIAPGNSGGPLISRETGEVLGINSAGTDQGTIGFSIPIPTVLALIEGWSNSPMAALPQIDENSEGYANVAEGYSDKELAHYLVNYYYESINYEDYVTAYSLLGSNWQSETSYEAFREGYLYTEFVTIDDIAVTDSEGETLTVIAMITAEERQNGNTKYKKFKAIYTVGYENDQMKLLSGEAEIIE